MRARIAFLAALALLGPGCVGEGGEPVPFRTLDLGVYSGYAERSFTVLATQAEYEAAWAKHASGSEPRGPAPQVDFSKERVALVALGDQRGQCDDLRVEKVTRAADKVTVRVVQQDSRGGGCEAVVKQPIHVVAFEDATSAVEFAVRTVKQSPDWPPPGIPVRAVETLGGSTLARGASSGIHDDARLLVRDETTFAALWAEHGKDGDAPRVGFASESVLVVVSRGPECDGIRIGNVTYVVQDGVFGGTIDVEVVRGGAQCSAPQEDAYEFRAIPHRIGEVRFYDARK